VITRCAVPRHIPDAERQAARIAVERDELHLFALFEGARSFLVAVLGADLEQVQFAPAAHVCVHLPSFNIVGIFSS
jgi:hypothetical protein